MSSVKQNCRYIAGTGHFSSEDESKLLSFGYMFVLLAGLKNEFTKNKENDSNNVPCKVDGAPKFNGQVNT